MNGAVGLFGEQYINLCDCLLEANISADSHENCEGKGEYGNEILRVSVD